MTDMREAVARAIAGSIAKQDGCDEAQLPDDLMLSWLDQGEVDFGLVADAAITAMRNEK